MTTPGILHVESCSQPKKQQPGEINLYTGYPSKPGETGKWSPGREKTGNNVKIIQNWEKTRIILGSVKRGSTSNDKTRNTGFYVLLKLIS